MISDVNTDRYYFQREDIIDDNDSDFVYKEIDDDVDSGQGNNGDEDLYTTCQALKETYDDAALRNENKVMNPSVHCTNELVEDFIRNFLVAKGMQETFDCFQAEWFELTEKGMNGGGEEDKYVADVYATNVILEGQVLEARRCAEAARLEAQKAKDKFLKLTKERDYHLMHHRRVQQEKEKLLQDFIKLKEYYATYQPAFENLKRKYDVAMKEKMLTQIERDRAVSQVDNLKNVARTMDNCSTSKAGIRLSPIKDKECSFKSTNFQKTLSDEKSLLNHNKSLNNNQRNAKDSKFPLDTGVNPLLKGVEEAALCLTNPGGFLLEKSFVAHAGAVTSVKLHEEKNYLATTSDDRTWKMWNLMEGNQLLVGIAHSDWIADCDFDPTGSRLGTVSGDHSMIIWDTSNAKLLHTFADHQKAVWSIAWHHCGSFVATSSMDASAKVWDLNSLRCRYTLRGHKASVNCVRFLAHSNMLVTCSADKKVAVWDARTALCCQIFHGHEHSINSCNFNMKGDAIVSCDSFGVTKVWDLRTGSALVSANYGPHSANMATFDPTGKAVAIASNNGTINVLNVHEQKMVSLIGHDDSVQCLQFNFEGRYIVSGGCDLTVRTWS